MRFIATLEPLELTLMLAAIVVPGYWLRYRYDSEPDE